MQVLSPAIALQGHRNRGKYPTAGEGRREKGAKSDHPDPKALYILAIRTEINLLKDKGAGGRGAVTKTLMFVAESPQKNPPEPWGIPLAVLSWLCIISAHPA